MGARAGGLVGYSNACVPREIAQHHVVTSQAVVAHHRPEYDPFTLTFANEAFVAVAVHSYLSPEYGSYVQDQWVGTAPTLADGFAGIDFFLIDTFDGADGLTGDGMGE